MARLLDNAWSFWTSNTDIDRNTGGGTGQIVPSLVSQSSHGGFAVASTNQMHFGSGTPTGRYSVYCTSLSGDGDDNEEGSAALLISFGTTSNATSDLNAKNFSLTWSNLNSTHPDVGIMFNGQYDINVDGADHVVQLYYQTKTFYNTNYSTNPAFRILIQQF